MSLEKSEAILLKTFNWSESSRTLVFLARRHGRIALTDKGGRSIKSRRGRPIPMARLEITFYASEKESNGYLNQVDLIEAWSFEAEGTLGRLAYGSAACEVLNRLLPDEEPHPLVYDFLATFLKYVDVADRRSLPAMFLAFLLQVVGQLGYPPQLQACLVCQRPLSEALPPELTQIRFVPERGGICCPTCQVTGDYYIHISVAGWKELVALQNEPLQDAAARPVSYRDAAVLLEALTKFLSYQTGTKGDLKSLEFLEKLKNTTLNG